MQLAGPQGILGLGHTLKTGCCASWDNKGMQIPPAIINLRINLRGRPARATRRGAGCQKQCSYAMVKPGIRDEPWERSP